jgi:outer membrane protein assembly factor BamB
MNRLIVIAAILSFVILTSGVLTQPEHLGGLSVARAAQSAADPVDWWPMFHHDLNRTGCSTSTAPTTNASLWINYTFGQVESSPAVANGIVYVGSDDGHVYALYAANGSQVWSFSTGGPVRSSPAVANGVVYVGSDDDDVYALNATTGLANIWSSPYNTTSPVGYSSPAVANGVVYVGSDNNYVYALNATNGYPIWSQSVTYSTVSSPAVANGVVYVCSTTTVSDAVSALYASNGTIMWQLLNSLGQLPGAPIFSSPAVFGNVVYFSCDGWTCACNATTGSAIWSYYTLASSTLAGPYSSCAVAYEGPNNSTVVYVGGINWTSALGEVYALNATRLSPASSLWGGQTPSCLWNYTTGPPWVDSSPAAANGMVFVGSDDYSTYALNAITGALVWKYKTSGPVFSSPAVANGVVYVGSDDYNVYAFGLVFMPGGPTTTNIVTDKDNGTTQRIVCNGYNMTVYVTLTQGTTTVSSVDVYVYFSGTPVLFGSLRSQPVFSTGVTSLAVTCNATGASSNPAWYNALPLTVQVTGPGDVPLYCTNATAFAIEVTGPGDINADHYVNMNDVILALRAFGTYMASPPPPPQPSFNGQVTINWATAARAYPDADINDKHAVNMANVIIILLNFGHFYP